MNPTELLYWMRKWDLDDNLIYKKASENHVIFVRDKICGNLLKTRCFVVSTHRSKSCQLPVCFMKLRNGIEIIMRFNFYDWKVSVKIPENYEPLPANYLPIDCLSHSLVEHIFDKIPPCYCEGFKEEWCYEAYNPQKPPMRFTIEVPDNYRLYTIIHFLKHAYPDIIFNIEDDKRTLEEIKETIEQIFANNGINEFEEEEFMDKKIKHPLMSGWEILWRTYTKIEDMCNAQKIKLDKSITISNDPQTFAEAIVKIPEAHAEFLMEEWMLTPEMYLIRT